MRTCQKCYDLFVDINNMLYCSLGERHQVIAKSLNDSTNKFLIVAGTGSANIASNALNNPRGIFVDINFDLYVADCGNNRIQLFHSGKLTGITVAGNSSSNLTITLNCPTDIILDADKNLFIVDIGCSGSSGSASNQLNNPWSISFDSYGNIFVTDQGNNRVQKFIFSINSTSTMRFFWDFDGNLQDNGIGINTPTYQSPGYNAAGSCLYLYRSASQSVTVPTPPFLNMSYTSFTFEVWMYAQTLCDGATCVDNAIFGQYDQSVNDHILYLIIRNQSMYFGFYEDDLSGNQTLNTDTWYHLAFVYDYSTMTQFVYVNGYLDESRQPAGPYQGTQGPLTIGTDGVNAPNNYFDGCLDYIAYFSRAKSASEILNDATLVVYLSFDGNTLLDSGPLLINGTGTNYSYTPSGQVNAALTLPGPSSYVQITGLTRLGTYSWPYSVAIWIYPTSLAGGTIIHLSSRTDGAQPYAWCLPIMGLTSSGQIALDSWNGTNVTMTGPLVSLNTWTHVAGTYSPTNGERLYVNGILKASSAPYDFSTGGVPMTITLGSSLLGTGVCSSGAIQMGQFYGSLDEFYVYARELSATEVAALANV